MRASSSAGLSAALTSTVSVTAPTPIVTLSVTVWPTLNLIPNSWSFLNPWSSATTLYVPSGSRRARKSPASLLTTTRWAPVSVLVTVTVTPGSTPPEVSTTEPSMEPLAACD